MKKYLYITAFALALLTALIGSYAHAETAAEPARPGVRVGWNAPKDVDPSAVAGYNIYRSGSMLGHYERLNQSPVTELFFEDRGGEATDDALEKGAKYYYRLTTVFADGSESAPSEPVGMEAGGPLDTATLRLPGVEFFTTDALGRVVYAGEEAVFLLKGDPGLSATLDIPGAAYGLEMEEVQPGTYKAAFTVPPGIKLRGISATATLSGPDRGFATVSTPDTINMLGWVKPTLTGLYAGMLESDRVGLNWDAAAYEGGSYTLFRDTARIVGTEDTEPLTGSIPSGASSYIDADVRPGSTYYYVLALVNEDGLVEAYSPNLEVTTPDAGRVSGIDQVAEDSAGRTLVPGDTLYVSMATVSGGEASFTLSDAARDVKMAETDAGVYAGTYTVRDGDGVFKSRVAVSFRDKDGKSHFTNSATYVSVDAPRTGDTPATDGTGPAIYAVEDDAAMAAGRSGRLTAGRTLTVTMTGEPGNRAYFNIGEGIWKVAMSEDQQSPGTYTGRYTIAPGDNAGTSPDPLAQMYVECFLVSAAGKVSGPARTVAPVIVDTTCNIEVAVENQRLKANAVSQSRVDITVTDADGEPVKDRRMTVSIEPPPRYTGVVGGGGVGVFDPEQDEAANGGLGRVELDFDNLTDMFGHVGATYTSGYAAKTAMIVVRDQSTGSIGVGYAVTEISSSVSIVLEDPDSAAATAAKAQGYELVVEFTPEDPPPDVVLPYFMVNAIPDTLTADGKSRASVVATLTKDGVPVEGRRIIFAVTGAGGSVTVPGADTDGMGRAQTFYVAGIKAGYAVITATEAETGVTVTKTVTLLADAPAKIFAAAEPAVLPADGVSGSDITVRVADVNDNPTEGASLDFSLAGAGRISDYSSVTDFDGTSRFYYTAGSTPGVATIDITAVSMPPTVDELERMACTVTAPLVYDNFGLTELVVLKWYRSAGDQVGKGEPLALVQTPLGDMKVFSPVDGRLAVITIEPGIYVMEGREIGIIEK